MNKLILVYLLLICIIWGGVYFFQEQKIKQDIKKAQEIFETKYVRYNTNISEPRFEVILDPDEYDFDDLHAGPVYEKAGTKIKVDFSYMLDKKLGDEVTIHFPNASVKGKIVKYEVENGPERILYYNINIDVNDTMEEGGYMSERIFLSLYDQYGPISGHGSFETTNASGLFILEKGVGYFATKEEYGNAVMELGIKTD